MGQPRKVLATHPCLAGRRNPEIVGELSNRDGGELGGLELRQTRDVLAKGLGDDSVLVRHRDAVELGHDRKVDRHGDAVGGVVEAADGFAHAMDGGDVGVAERHSREQARQGHVVAGIEVPAVRVGPSKALADQPDRGDRQTVGKGLSQRRRVPLDRVCQRVDAGVGGDAGRKTDRELRIDERHGRGAQAGCRRSS